jgi:hypothetical protein
VADERQDRRLQGGRGEMAEWQTRFASVSGICNGHRVLSFRIGDG